MARLLTGSKSVSGLLLSIFFAPVVAGEFNTTREFILPSATQQLIVVDQLGTDVQVTLAVTGHDPVVIDHPVGRTGPEYLTVGPYSQDRSVSVEIRHDYTEPQFEIRVSVIEPASSEAVAAELLTEAGIAAAGSDRAGFQNALGLYRRVSEMQLDAYHLSDFASFMQATLLLEATELAESLELLEQFDGSFLGVFDYKRESIRADIANGQDDYALARAIYEPLITRLRESPKDLLPIIELDLAEMEGVLGFAQILTGDPDQGVATLQSALSIAERYSDVNLIGELHNNLAGYHSFSRNFEQASEHFNQALDYLWSTDDTQSIVYTLANMSMNYADLGEYAMARDTAHMALMRAEEGMDGSQMSTAYTRLASLYLRIGEYRIAVDFARLAQQYDLETDREWRSYTMKAVEGDALLRTGQVDEAIRVLRETLAYFRANGPTQRVIATQQRLIRAYLQKGDLETANQNLVEALNLSQQQDSRPRGGQQTSLLLLRAEILLARDDASEAVAVLELIADTLDDYVSPRHVEVTSLLMQARAALGQTAQAITSGYQAVDYIARIRRQLEFSRLGPAWSGATYPVYLNLVHNLVQAATQSGEEERYAEALAVAEQGLANNLAQQLLSARNGNVVETNETLQLRRELANLARQRAASVGTDRYSDVTLEYFKVRERYQASLDLDPVAPDLEVPTVSQLQARLGSDDVVLELTCVPGQQCYGFLLTSDDFKVKALGDYVKIEQLAHAVQTGARDNRGAVSRAAQELGFLLLADLLPGDRSNLFLVANYPLSTLPMALLGNGRSDEYVPLVNDYALSQLPSLTTFYHLQESPQPEYRYELAVLADPEFSIANEQPLVVVPSGEAADSLRGWYDELERLPWSAREAENLREIYTGLPVRTMTGSQASKSNLLDEATRNSRIVHIASHGYFNSETPDLVGIATTPRPDEAGFVTLDDLILYPFNAELVVISGCETGLGQERGGEGLMSLSRGFLGQGVDHVISTLWPVSDRASAEFMRLFYTALHGEGQSPAGALRTAQVQLARNPQYRAPFYWAAYTLTSMSL